MDIDSNSQSKQSVIEIKLAEDKQIRSMAFINNGSQVALMLLLEVVIYDLNLGSVIKSIKRLASPKHLVPFPHDHKLLIIHYSDNYCFLYDTKNYEMIYDLRGICSDHKGIKVSGNGKHVFYGNDTAMQMWNITQSSIEMLCHKMKFINCYNINYNGTQVYLGNFNGELQAVMMLKHGNSNTKVPYGKTIKLNCKVIMGIQLISYSLICTIDFCQQCCIISLKSHKFQKLQHLSSPSKPIPKPISFGFSTCSSSLHWLINDQLSELCFNKQSLSIEQDQIDNVAVVSAHKCDVKQLSKIDHVQVQMIVKGRKGKVAIGGFYGTTVKNHVIFKQL